MTATLQEHNFRLVKRGPDFRWVHPLEMKPGDVDCTDMTDEEFDAFVKQEMPE